MVVPVSTESGDAPRPWWAEAVFYEIYIRSFQDSNGDGIGDLDGITSRLDALADLGVDALWITPFYPSPQVDFGYDISDHEDIDPQFGCLADFDRLIGEAHRRGMKVVVDLVLNHTSDRHAWFEASRASRHNGYRDWYVWRDGRPGGQPPNNWESAFGGPAWTFDPATGQWYYHYFYAQQPDLNWRNPRVEARMFQMAGFWLDRGADGFRLDAVNTLFEDPGLRDNPLLRSPRVKLTGVVTQDHVHTRGLPEIHDVIRRLRAYVDKRATDAVLISEAYVDSTADLTRFYGTADAPGVHLPFNFMLTQTPSLNAAGFKRAIEEVERAVGDRWPSLVFNNHDIDRACSRYGRDDDRDAIARLLAVLLLTSRGTPFLYYGDEIAMGTYPPTRLDEVRDPVGRAFWPRYKGRDGVRRPMQWSGAAHAGFSTAEPWLALSPDAATRHVGAQRRDHGSVLRLHRDLISARRTYRALRAGGYEGLSSAAEVFAFARWTTGETLIVVLNCSGTARSAGLRGIAAGTQGHAVVGSHRREPGAIALDRLQLAPFEAIVLNVTP
jgi:alpha-glucosidase